MSDYFLCVNCDQHYGSELRDEELEQPTCQDCGAVEAAFYSTNGR